MTQVLSGERFQFTLAPSARAPEAFAESVRAGLSAPAKALSCRWFYNAHGSELFERICELPEYYLTRTERAILEAHAPEIVARLPEDVTLVELGSGSSVKTRLLIAALLERQSRLCYCPIDVAAPVLRRSGRELLAAFPRLEVHAVAAEYGDGLARVGGKGEQPRLILFLGSTLGNFTLEEAGSFLRLIRRAMTPGDHLLLGADLKKAREIIEPAYNDAAGITEAFNKNLLVRINEELGGAFDLAAFRHHAPYLEARDRVEMRLVSRVAQEVPITALGRSFRFEEGEWIHTEICHKYTEAQLTALAAGAGLRLTGAWQDPRHWFTLRLLAPEGEAPG
jgi:L-histidine N-alpha-methyltransferase